ncbi:hypothetical protein [Comamonas humi]
MLKPLLIRAAVLAAAPLALGGCSLWPLKKAPAAPPAAQVAQVPAAPASAAAAKAEAPAARIAPAELHGVWECSFQIRMGEDVANFTYTDQFHSDGSLRSQAYLVYDMPSTRQQYAYVLQGEGHWRMQDGTITLIVPEVVRQDRSKQKNSELLKDKDLVPEDLSDTWTVQVAQGRKMRVLVGSLADEMLCEKE